MDIKYINPFIEGVRSLFSTMLGCEAQRAGVRVLDEDPSPPEITGIIGIGGRFQGSVALSLPTLTALAVTQRLVAANVKVVEDTVFDAVGEAINIVVGRAKAMLSTPGETPLQVSLPTVLRGRDYCVMSPSNSVWLDIPFVSDLGPFNLRLCFESK